MARKKRNSIDGQFNARLIEMMESPAYRVLSLSAHRVLDRISIELAQHGGNDNGRLPVTYEHFVEYGLHRHAIAPAIRELEALGFLVVTQRGRPSAGEFRLPNLFSIPWINCKSNPTPTHAWRRFADIEAAEAAATRARTGRQKQKASDGNRHCASDGNRHCDGQSPVMETTTTVQVPETITTSISPVVTPAKSGRVARPPKGAVASDRTDSDAVLQAALSRLGAAVREPKNINQ